MTRNWIEVVTGSLEDKRQWRRYKARKAALPEPYRTAIAAVERYLVYAGGIAKSEQLVAMADDLATLFEQAAADNTSIHALLGGEPVTFVEDFVRNYDDGSWVAKERARLTAAIARLEDEPS